MLESQTWKVSPVRRTCEIKDIIEYLSELSDATRNFTRSTKDYRTYNDDIDSLNEEDSQCIRRCSSAQAAPSVRRLIQ